MQIFASKRGKTAAFPLNPVAAGCAILVSALAAPAYAQQTPVSTEAGAEPAPQSVVISGIRTGIEAAISIKKNSSSIVEAISAEDLGKLPDSSVAESIARLPGVTAQRTRNSGKAADISVRGLSPSFNGTLLNGREQASTGNARSPEFDLFPAELMGSVVIYKTPDAQLIGSGLAATIDLRTVQPLDFGKRVMAANYRKQRSGIRAGGEEGDGRRTSFSYIDQFANRTIGLAFGITSYKETSGAQRKFDSWGGWAPTLNYNGSPVSLPGGFTADTETAYGDRDAAMASLQFRPSKNFKSTLDFFWSKGSNAQKKTGLEGAIGGDTNGAYDPAGVLSNVTVVNGVATSGTLSNYKGVVRNHLESSEDDLKTFGWNNNWKLNDWNLIADLTHSKARKQATRYETTAGLPGNATSLDSITWSGFNGTNFTDVKYSTGLNYSDRSKITLTDVNGWSGGASSPQAGYVALPHVEDKVDSLRLSGKRDIEWGPIAAATFGMNYTKRDKSRTGQEGRLVIKGGNPYGTAAMPGTGTSVAGTTGLPIMSWDPSGSLGSIYELSEKVDADILNKDWSVDEKVTTAYVMGDLDGKAFGLNYRGNVGTQIVRTDQQSTGNQVDTARCVGNTRATCPSKMVSDGVTFTDVLPSANVSFDLENDQFLRFGVARVLSRANLDDLRASQGFSVSTTSTSPILVGSGGNAKLKPFKAKSLDVSYEKYFGKKAYFSAAAFYKKLDTYIFRAPQVFDFGPYISPGTPLPTSGPHAGSTVGLMTAPINGDGGSIKGYELSLNLPLSMASEYLDGFGIMANTSNTKSAIELPLSGFSTSATGKLTIPLPGLSRKVSNLRLYYEKYGFQVAAAARKRSDFLGQVSDFQDNSQLTFIKGETIVDLQASYEFQKTFLKGLSVYVQANNWNNAPWQEFTESSDSVTRKVIYGRTYQFGLNYKF
jgi:iron complex outermembrane receptor protein